MPSQKKRDFTCYLTPELFQRLETECENTGLRRSNLIEQILRQHFKLPLL